MWGIYVRRQYSTGVSVFCIACDQMHYLLFYSVPSYQGALYSKQPWKLEILSPSERKACLVIGHLKRFRFLNWGFLSWDAKPISHAAASQIPSHYPCETWRDSNLRLLAIPSDKVLHFWLRSLQSSATYPWNCDSQIVISKIEENFIPFIVLIICRINS